MLTKIRRMNSTWKTSTALIAVLVAAQVFSCKSKPKEEQKRSAAQKPPLKGVEEAGADKVKYRPAGPLTRKMETRFFRRLRVVNGKPFPDMYFKHYGVNPTIDTDEEDTSTFSVDVDTTAYTMARSYLNRGHLPPEEAIRVEEFINRFDYGYQAPKDRDLPFSVQAQAFPSPNRKGYNVLHIGLKGREVKAENRKPTNLVFVIDVSGSMGMENRLGLVKRALKLLVGQLKEKDSVGIVVYGSSARVVLEPTTAMNKAKILEAIQNLRTGGSTNAQAGIRLGYKMAAKRFRKGWINRVILCSDGVANNGITSAGGIFKDVKKEAAMGVTISTVGFGMGNYNDVLMEKLAQMGNGNYHYVDQFSQARRVFVENLTGTLQVIAKDVKIQMVFNKKVVSRYRLLGYENRQLKKKDFKDDRVDAGEIGAGHSVTAIYEVKFHKTRPAGPLANLKIRFKAPQGKTSALMQKPIPQSIVAKSYKEVASPTKLSMVAAAFAEKLRRSYWVRNMTYADILKLMDQISAPLSKRADVVELRLLIEKARKLDSRKDKFANAVPVAQMDFDKVPVIK